MEKLVRNKIPALIKADGKKPKVRKLKDDAEYIEALKNKLIEEAKEYTMYGVIDELADVLQVIEDICKVSNTPFSELKKIKVAKKKEKGGFNGRKFLVSIKD